MMMFLRSLLRLQNDGLNGGISLSDDRFPASGTADRRVSKWPLAEENAPPLFSRTDSSLDRHRKWPPYGASSLDSEFLAHWNALTGF